MGKMTSICTYSKITPRPNDTEYRTRFHYFRLVIYFVLGSRDNPNLTTGCRRAQRQRQQRHSQFCFP